MTRLTSSVAGSNSGKTTSTSSPSSRRTSEQRPLLLGGGVSATLASGSLGAHLVRARGVQPRLREAESLRDGLQAEEKNYFLNDPRQIPERTRRYHYREAVKAGQMQEMNAQVAEFRSLIRPETEAIYSINSTQPKEAERFYYRFFWQNPSTAQRVLMHLDTSPFAPRGNHLIAENMRLADSAFSDPTKASAFTQQWLNQAVGRSLGIAWPDDMGHVPRLAQHDALQQVLNEAEGRFRQEIRDQYAHLPNSGDKIRQEVKGVENDASLLNRLDQVAQEGYKKLKALNLDFTPWHDMDRNYRNLSQNLALAQREAGRLHLMDRRLLGSRNILGWAAVPVGLVAAGLGTWVGRENR